MSAKGQSRLNEVSGKEPSEERVSPLFARNDPPIPADHIAEIKLQRLLGKDRHVDLPMSDFYIQGDPDDHFVIDPYDVDEQDLQKQFGGGEYWIEARRKPDGALWKGSGRRLVLGGPPKGSDDQEDESDEDEQEYEEPGTVTVTPPTAPVIDPNQHKVYELLDRQSKMTQEHADLQVKLAQERADRETAMERERANRESQAARERADRETAMAQDYAERKVAMHGEFATTILQMAQGQGNKDPNASQEVVRVLREENDSLRARLRQDNDDIRREHRESLDKRDRQHEDTLRADRQRADREIDDLRRRGQAQEDELRRRWMDDAAELRSRHERDMTQARGELLELRTKLQGDLDRARQDYDQRIRALERENIDLEKKANGIQAELNAVQNAPPGGPTITDRIMAMAQTPVGQAMLGQVLAATMANAAPPAPATPVPVAAPQGFPPNVSNDPGMGYVNPDVSPESHSVARSNVIPFTPTAAVPAPWMSPTVPSVVEVPRPVMPPTESQPMAATMAATMATSTQPHGPVTETSAPPIENARSSMNGAAPHAAVEPIESTPATPA